MLKLQHFYTVRCLSFYRIHRNWATNIINTLCFIRALVTLKALLFPIQLTFTRIVSSFQQLNFPLALAFSQYYCKLPHNLFHNASRYLNSLITQQSHVDASATSHEQNVFFFPRSLKQITLLTKLFLSVVMTKCYSVN